MELVKKVVNMLLENRIEFEMEFTEKYVEIVLNYRSDFDIEKLLKYHKSPCIMVQNKETGVNGFCFCSFEDLQQYTPFKAE